MTEKKMPQCAHGMPYDSVCGECDALGLERGKSVASVRAAFESTRGARPNAEFDPIAAFKWDCALQEWLACYQHLVPEGYVVVPKEPTMAMLKAGIKAFQHAWSISNPLSDWRAAYIAEIDAALDLQKEKQQ